MNNFNIEFKVSPITAEKDGNDQSINDAIQTIYSFDDDLILNWDNVIIVLSIKGDISVSWKDLIEMIENLKNNKIEFEMHWPSESFWMLWKFKTLDATNLKIETTSLLMPSLIINRIIFLEQWLKVIAKIHEDLSKRGYDISSLDIYP